jgi:hypothetical protein
MGGVRRSREERSAFLRMISKWTLNKDIIVRSMLFSHLEINKIIIF